MVKKVKMEIYNNQQKDFTITELRQGVRNENRVNVFVGGKFSFSLDISQVVDLGVKVGRKISAEELENLKKASEFGKLYQRALEKALTRPHSEKEMRDYLVRKLKNNGLSSEDILQLSQQVLERLSARGYVDDLKFAEYYVENRFVKKGVSRRRLSMELSKKGVKKEIIEEVLSESERNDAEEIRKIIAKKRAKYDDDELVAYLCRQGFSYGLAREQVSEFETD